MGPLIQNLPVHRSFVYLGHDVQTAPRLARIALKKRANKASATSFRIAQLPLTVSVHLRSCLIAAVMGPQWAFGLLTQITSNDLMTQMEQAFRRALWARHKKMHSWLAAVSLVYDPLKISAWGTQTYRHILALFFCGSSPPHSARSGLMESPCPGSPGWSCSDHLVLAPPSRICHSGTLPNSGS